ncbi:MAG: hypothetical protein AVDCRST_MAG30-2748, partial [uncultured Solirubrobacteraceae bacterium]
CATPPPTSTTHPSCGASAGRPVPPKPRRDATPSHASPRRGPAPRPPGGPGPRCRTPPSCPGGSPTSPPG